VQIILVRHGQPAWMPDGRAVANPELTELGHRQARLMGEYLAGWDLDEIWVSPLVRAQQTAAPLAEATGLMPQTYDWLAEARPPNMEGLDANKLREIFGGTRQRSVAEWWKGHLDGEPLDDFVARVSGGLDGILGERGGSLDDSVRPPLWRDIPKGTKVAVVCHAGTTAAAMSHLLGLEQVPWAWERFYAQHASVTTLRTVALAQGLIFSLRGFSLTEHLPPEAVTI